MQSVTHTGLLQVTSMELFYQKRSDLLSQGVKTPLLRNFPYLWFHKSTGNLHCGCKAIIRYANDPILRLSIFQIWQHNNNQIIRHAKEETQKQEHKPKKREKLDQKKNWETVWTTVAVICMSNIDQHTTFPSHKTSSNGKHSAMKLATSIKLGRK